MEDALFERDYDEYSDFWFTVFFFFNNKNEKDLSKKLKKEFIMNSFFICFYV